MRVMKVSLCELHGSTWVRRAIMIEYDVGARYNKGHGVKVQTSSFDSTVKFCD